LELVLLAEGITVSLRSDFELERVKNSYLCLGGHPNFSGNPPTAYSQKIISLRKALWCGCGLLKFLFGRDKECPHLRLEKDTSTSL
jgi:hypothetical protein